MTRYYQPADDIPMGQRIIQPMSFYSAAETAWYLRIGRRTLKQWRTEGRGPKVTVLCDGGQPIYLGEHILEFVTRENDHDTEAMGEPGR